MKKSPVFEGRRNHLQVLSEILELCRLPQAKTSILRNTNTSFKLLENYLLQLQTSGLLELQTKTRKYTTTLEGQRFIETWLYLKALLYPQEPPIPQIKKYAISSNHLGAVPTKNPQMLNSLKI